ncbi:MAG: CHAT domain-containing protein, partial [Leptolyngbya sp. SIO4C1]|nr:CHAT domain-containing protein [Leptolyngbya sp. SIO4C1]
MGKFALLIGVSDYLEGLSALPAATQDVAALQRILADPVLGAFDNVKTLLNPTRDEMAQRIELWLAELQKDDLALLFFSGHGVKDERRDLYFAAGNTQKNRDRLVRSTAVAARTIHEFLCDSRPKQQVVILDCCFSGAFGELLPRDDGEMALEAQLAAEGRVVLTSTSAVDYAFEEKASGQSLYTRYLVEGIEKGTADLNGDGFITVDELHQFASR